MRCAAFILMFSLAAPVVAADKPSKAFVVVNDVAGVPVFPNDITDRPYTVLGEVKAGVRKATLFSAEASQGKIYRELWERAEKMGADAVVNARYGESKISAMSWGQTDASGTAIKFTAAAAPDAAAVPVAAAAPEAVAVPVAAPEAEATQPQR
jgi:uncharacterized protein YbjQ (UPF0145 family)